MAGEEGVRKNLLIDRDVYEGVKLWSYGKASQGRDLPWQTALNELTRLGIKAAASAGGRERRSLQSSEEEVHGLQKEIEVLREDAQVMLRLLSVLVACVPAQQYAERNKGWEKTVVEGFRHTVQGRERI